jgi:hypothetical protein
VAPGGEPQPKSVEEFLVFIADQHKRWDEVIRMTRVSLNKRLQGWCRWIFKSHCRGVTRSLWH